MRLIVLVILSLVSSLSYADFDKGLACYKKQDFACTLDNWKPLAETGIAEVQYNLAVMYTNGKGVKQDYFEAFKLFQLAAEQGDAYGQLNLGFSYLLGQGVGHDRHQAKQWFGKACDNRSDEGCKRYAMFD